jgi:hypothetical protein
LVLLHWFGHEILHFVQDDKAGAGGEGKKGSGSAAPFFLSSILSMTPVILSETQWNEGSLSQCSPTVNAITHIRKEKEGSRNRCSPVIKTLRENSCNQWTHPWLTQGPTPLPRPTSMAGCSGLLVAAIFFFIRALVAYFSSVASKSFLYTSVHPWHIKDPPPDPSLRAGKGVSSC